MKGWAFVGSVFLLLAILSSGCIQSGGDSPVVLKEKKPDIRVTSSNLERSFSLSEGAIAQGTYTLTNYGDADGYVTVSFDGDYSGTIHQETIFVPAQNSVTKNIRLDIRNEDKSVGVRILKQTKSS